MNKIKKSIYTVLAISMLVFPLAGCGNDDEDESKGEEKNGVHKPKDDYKETGNVNRLEDEPKDEDK